MRRTPTDNNWHEPPPLDKDRRDPNRPWREPSPRRRSLLRDDPDIDVVDMATLVEIARAIEDEAVRRYAMLAELMSHRGEHGVAVAFQVMLDEERRHVDAVDRWATSVGDPVVPANHFEWHLPADLSSSWDDIAGSALLTPYRAFALAVENEERAFSFYAYLAARAENEQVRAEAEKLGGEELRHAALLRRWRRRAYHRERRSAQPTPLRPVQLQLDSVEALRDFLAQQDAEIAATHRALAQQLERAGDKANARFLEQSIPRAAQTPATGVAAPPAAPGSPTAAAGSDVDPRHLLVDAQKPLEAVADVLEAVMATSDGELFEEAATAMSEVIERIAGIALRID